MAFGRLTGIDWTLTRLLARFAFGAAAIVGTVTSASAANFTLNWVDNSANETGFRIERSVNGAAYLPLATVAANVISYVDTTAAVGATHWYRVRAFNAAGESGHSNAVQAALAQGLSISGLSDVSIAPGGSGSPLVLTLAGAAGIASGTIALSGSSSDSALLPDANIVFSGTGVTRTITLYPQKHRTGTTTVTVTVSNGTSSVSSSFQLTVSGTPASNPEGRLLNLSVRSHTRGGADVLIPGFSIVGSGTKRLLLRAIGPTLGAAPFHLPGVLPDPRMVLRRWNGTTFVEYAANDNWGDSGQANVIRDTSAGLFAFGLPDASLDAALLVDLPSGVYTVVTDDVASAAGSALFEIYDVDAEASGTGLQNLSNRGFVGAGADDMIVGFVISPEGSKQLLLRAVGPALAAAPFYVPGTLSDPLMQVYRKNDDGSDVLVLTNDDWNNDPEVVAAGQHASAFPLAAGSRDAAIVATLPPGVYTVVARGANGSTGQALVEAYVVD